ncbi:hypothetical protein IT575_01920 [bacterium]|nr:hypothetical protein [bacterium]
MLHGDELKSALLELQQLTPGDAAPFYYEGWLACRAGDYEWARRAFADGNRRQRCSTLDGCPLDTYYGLISAGKAPADKLVGASLAQLEYLDSGIDHYTVRQSFKRALSYCMDQHDLDLLAELHTALCRIARAEGQGNYDALLICEQLRNIAQELAQQP